MIILKKAEKMFDLKYETNRIIDNRQVKGYYIKGKLRNYFLEYNIEDQESRPIIMGADDGHYFCVLERTEGGVTPLANCGISSLLNRIYALHNDEKLSSQILVLQKFN